MSPCLLCVEKTCHECSCAICENVGGDLQDTNMMKAAMLNQLDYEQFVTRLLRELKEIEKEEGSRWIDKHSWRGISAGLFDYSHLLSWVISRYKKETL